MSADIANAAPHATAAAAARTTDATARARRRSPDCETPVSRHLRRRRPRRRCIDQLPLPAQPTTRRHHQPPHHHDHHGDGRNRARGKPPESLRTKLATAIARNRELTEQLAQLRTENEALRSRLLESRIPAATPHPS